MSHITQPAVAETSSSKASVRGHVKHQQAAPGYILAMLCRVLLELPTNSGTLYAQLALGFEATVTDTAFGVMDRGTRGALYRIAYAQHDTLPRFAQWHAFLK